MPANSLLNCVHVRVCTRLTFAVDDEQYLTRSTQPVLVLVCTQLHANIAPVLVSMQSSVKAAQLIACCEDCGFPRSGSSTPTSISRSGGGLLGIFNEPSHLPDLYISRQSLMPSLEVDKNR